MSRLHDLHPHEQISALLDGELTAAEASAVEVHLASCAECRALAEDLRTLHRAIASEEVPVLPDTLVPRLGWAIRSATAAGAAEAAEAAGRAAAAVSAASAAGGGAGASDGAAAERPASVRRRWTFARSSFAAGSLAAASFLLFLVLREDPMQSARIAPAPEEPLVGTGAYADDARQAAEESTLRPAGKEAGPAQAPGLDAAGALLGSASAGKTDAPSDRSLERSSSTDRLRPASRFKQDGMAHGEKAAAAGQPLGFAPVPPASDLSKDKSPSRDSASMSGPRAESVQTDAGFPGEVDESATQGNRLDEAKTVASDALKKSEGSLRAEGARQEPGDQRANERASQSAPGGSAKAAFDAAAAPPRDADLEALEVAPRPSAAIPPAPPASPVPAECPAPFEPIPGPLVVRTPNVTATLDSLRQTVEKLGGSIRKTREKGSEWRIEIPPARYGELLAWVRSHRKEQIPRAAPLPPLDNCALLRVQFEPPTGR